MLVIGLAGLPDFGDYHGVYGQVINGIGVTERHATDLVTALNFDFRGFDTLGEEFILFGSVLGIVLILRELRGEHERPSQEEAEEHTFGGASEALRALALVLVPGLIALGVYIVVHGQITPGGGFQGGVILAAGPLAVFLAGRYLRMRSSRPTRCSRSARRSARPATGWSGSAGWCSPASSSRTSCRSGSPGTCCPPGRSTSPASPSGSR